MMPENPAIGGTILRRASEQSPNYVAGTSGWTINQDGTAEFNSLTVRGNVVVQGNGEGLFVYNGTPKLGNPPVFSVVAPGVTTDPYGNAVDAVIMLADPTAINFVSGAAYEASPAVIFGDSQVGPPAFVQLFLNGARINLANHNDFVSIQLNSPNDSGTSSANIGMLYVDNAGTEHVYGVIDYRGFTAVPGTMRAPDPTTGTSALNPAAGENWHSIAIPSGWTDHSGNGTGFQYALAPFGITGYVVMLSVDMNTPSSAPANGTVIGTLPAAYRPTTTRHVLLSGITGGGAQTPHFDIDTAGQIKTEHIAASDVVTATPGFFRLD